MAADAAAVEPLEEGLEDHAEQEEIGNLRDYCLLTEAGPDHEYATGILRVPASEGRAKLSCEIVSLVVQNGRCLVAVPGTVWHKRPPKRLLPKAALLKATALEVAATVAEERGEPLAGTKLRIWVGLLDLGLEETVDYLNTEADYAFGVDAHGQALLPHAMALYNAVNDIFAFQSAESAGAAADPAGQLGDRLTTLEDAMAKIAAGFKVMMERDTVRAEPAKAAGPTLMTPKPKERPQPEKRADRGLQHPAPGQAYANLDPGVARAAEDAGVGAAALAEMDRLIGAAPLAPGWGKRGAQPAARGGLGLSESEDDGDQQPPQRAPMPEAAPDNPIEAVLQRLTQVVETLAKDKKPAGGQSKLDALLDGVSMGSGSSQEGSGAPRRNAAARRALRQALTENPRLISRTIAGHMAEDLLGISQPGVPPLTSARSWVEHRSRIGPYNTLAKTAWAAAGALDAIRMKKYEETEARLSVLILMLDQVGVDKGAWTLATELSLEPALPMHSFRLHETRDHEQAYSRLLDSRWAELAISHLREQMEFVEKRDKLSRSRAPQGAAQEEEEEEGQARTRAKPKAPPKK